ncbi:MAG: hypothetical protein AVDCRST_MAG54-1559, partial [uncultured Actinomycetospora sp.]
CCACWSPRAGSGGRCSRSRPSWCAAGWRTGSSCGPSRPAARCSTPATRSSGRCSGCSSQRCGGGCCA